MIARFVVGGWDDQFEYNAWLDDMDSVRMSWKKLNDLEILIGFEAPIDGQGYMALGISSGNRQMVFDLWILHT